MKYFVLIKGVTDRQNHRMTSFVVFPFHLMLFGRSYWGEWDGWGL